jgi:hypothetical protein
MAIDETPFQLSSDPERNPFAAPTTKPATEQLSRRERDARWLRWAWPMAIVLHLPITLWFGWAASADGFPKTGMFVGIAVTYWTGRQLCPNHSRLMKSLTIGAIATSVSQFWPIAQLFIGVFAMQISNAIFQGPSKDNLQNFPSVLVATLLTGTGLIVPSLLLGWMMLAVFDRTRD